MAEGVTMVLDAYKPNFKKELTSLCSRKLTRIVQLILNEFLFSESSLNGIPKLIESGKLLQVQYGDQQYAEK
jgi:hypothetical protein